MANKPAKVNLYYLALKRITNAKINLILATTILFFVGALNVGKMKFSFDERQTNVVANFMQIYEYENLHIKKGERLGNFELGSTIVILSEKDAIEYNLFENKELKFAEAIGRIRN